MKKQYSFRVTNSDTGDFFIIENDSMEELRIVAAREVEKRSWKNYYSETVV